MTEINNTKSQDPRLLYFTLVTAQVVFVANGEVQMITRSQFGSSPDPEFTARYLLQLQNNMAYQVKQQIEAQGATFDKALDVIILALAPLGRMTHEDFWAGMGEAPESVPLETQPIASAGEFEQSADMSNVTPLKPN